MQRGTSRHWSKLSEKHFVRCCSLGSTIIYTTWSSEWCVQKLNELFAGANYPQFLASPQNCRPYQEISGASCSGRGSWCATTLPSPSQRVIARLESCATSASYSLRATLCRLCLRSAAET